MPSALAGITVVDFTEYIAGPYCTMMLADMGANVIKVERPEGDAWRHTAPVAPYEGRGYLGVNRGKRSIALNLDGDEGRAIAHKLAATADVVTVDYRPGVAERLRLGYPALSAANPGLIYCENTAFGHVGPAGRGRNNYYRVDVTKGALIVVACLQNRQRRALRDALGVEDATVEGAIYHCFSEAVRVAHHELTEAIETTFRERTTREWLTAL